MQIKKLNKQQIQEIKNEHIICGDFGDGIPNFLSSDDCLVNKVRQKSINKEKLKIWKQQNDPKVFCSYNNMVGYKRNQELIDLNRIPDEIMNKIKDEFDKPYNSNRTRILPYFLKYKLKKLIESIADF